MSFNTDFSRKCTNGDHPTIYFNNMPVTQATVQKHIGLYLDEKLNHNYKERHSAPQKPPQKIFQANYC